MFSLHKVSAVILAAGEGKRMKSSHSKVIHRVLDRSMISWVVSACREAGAEQVIAVVGHRQDEVRAELCHGVCFAEQTQMLGTGDAVRCAEKYIGSDFGEVLILTGDAPLITGKTITEALNYHRESKNAVTVFTAEVENPFGYGRIIRDEDGSVLKIVEEKDGSEAERAVKEINGGMYCFNAEKLKYALSKINNDNSQGEYYLTDTIDILRCAGERVGAFKVPDPCEVLGVNDKLQLYQVSKIMQRRINEAHMKNGVVIWDIDSAYIGPEVEIEADAEILPNTIIFGKTRICEGAVIGPSSRIVNSQIGKNVTAANSVILDSFVDENTSIGPFAYLRPHSKIGKNCKVGDFVEIKNASFGDGSKASHLTYVGDAVVGSGVNFGCGTITVNYDGKKKHTTNIGNNVFIGCNTNLVAPVTVGDNSYIAAGSTITDYVPENSLAIARARQVIKTDWGDKRKKE